LTATVVSLETDRVVEEVVGSRVVKEVVGMVGSPGHASGVALEGGTTVLSRRGRAVHHVVEAAGPSKGHHGGSHVTEGTERLELAMVISVCTCLGRQKLTSSDGLKK
jgi:hypothetical protein